MVSQICSILVPQICSIFGRNFVVVHKSTAQILCAFHTHTHTHTHTHIHTLKGERERECSMVTLRVKTMDEFTQVERAEFIDNAVGLLDEIMKG